MRLADLQTQLHQYDILISSTASSLPLIGLGMVERAVKARRHKPMFMVDLAVPRDLDPKISQLEDVYLYTLDDLRNVIAANLQARAEAAEAEPALASRKDRLQQDLLAHGPARTHLTGASRLSAPSRPGRVSLPGRTVTPAIGPS